MHYLDAPAFAVLHQPSFPHLSEAPASAQGCLSQVSHAPAAHFHFAHAAALSLSKTIHGHSKTRSRSSQAFPVGEVWAQLKLGRLQADQTLAQALAVSTEVNWWTGRQAADHADVPAGASGQPATTVQSSWL